MTPTGPRTRRVVLDLEPSPDTIRGSVRGERLEPREFHGWLELSTLLDTLRPRPGAGELLDWC